MIRGPGPSARVRGNRPSSQPRSRYNGQDDASGPEFRVSGMARPQREMTIVPPETRFPVEVDPPPGFVADDLTTWPGDPGRFEYVDGRLLYMPPCGERQSVVAIDVAFTLRSWSLTHPEFVVGGNEVGVAFGRDKRGIDVAVWRRADLGPRTGGFVRVPPVLAVEVAGQDDREPYLRDKARWYLERGVAVVWLVLPETREVLVLSGSPATRHDSRHGVGDQLPAHEALPGLTPEVAAFFSQ